MFPDRDVSPVVILPQERDSWPARRSHPQRSPVTAQQDNTDATQRHGPVGRTRHRAKGRVRHDRDYRVVQTDGESKATQSGKLLDLSTAILPDGENHRRPFGATGLCGTATFRPICTPRGPAIVALRRSYDPYLTRIAAGAGRKRPLRRRRGGGTSNQGERRSGVEATSVAPVASESGGGGATPAIGAVGQCGVSRSPPQRV